MKTKSERPLKKGEQALLFPGETGAEPWEAWVVATGSAGRCVGMSATPEASRLKKGAALALPVSEVLCLPLWLNETDAKLFPQLIPLQLELRGLMPRHGPPVFDYSIVAQEGTRTLVTVGVLPAMLAPEVQLETCSSFDLSVRCLPLPENAITIWREQDRLAVAVSRGTSLLYFQSFPNNVLNDSFMQDLLCLRISLQLQDVLAPLQRIVLWTSAFPAEAAQLQTVLQIPVQQAERPQPQMPMPAWKLTPPAVTEAKKSRETWRWQVRLMGLALVIYLIFAGSLAIRYFVSLHQLGQLQKWQQDHNAALTSVRDTRSAWKALQSVTDEKNYPLELLLHVSQAIPDDQLHLTLFEANKGHLLIKGEGKNASAAFDFLNKLKADPYFSGYTWDMGEPHILPNDLAQLQIEGTRAGAN